MDAQTPIHSSQMWARGYSLGLLTSFATAFWFFLQKEQRSESLSDIFPMLEALVKATSVSADARVNVDSNEATAAGHLDEGHDVEPAVSANPGSLSRKFAEVSA